MPPWSSDTAVAGTHRLAQQRHGGFRHGVRRHPPFRHRPTRAPSTSTRRSRSTDDWIVHFKRRLHGCRGQHRCAAVRRVRRAGRVRLRPARPLAAGELPEHRSDGSGRSQLIFSSLHQILNNDDEKYALRGRRAQARSSAARSRSSSAPRHGPRARADLQRHDVRRLPRADQHHAGPGVRRRPDAGRFPRARSTARHARRVLADRHRHARRHPVRRTSRTARAAFSYPQQNFSVSEKATAGYIMGNLKGDRWRGNVGVRVVRRSRSSTARSSIRGWRDRESVRQLRPDHDRRARTRTCCPA